MPLGLGRVDRLLEAPEQAEVDGVGLGLVGGLGQDPLELEPALGVLDLDPQAPGELGELLELAGLGVGVGPAEEADLGSVRCEATASLAASMNSSMIWWLTSFEARWAPTTSPCSPRSISTSGMFSSSAPRLNRRFRRIMASSSIRASISRISG